MRNIKLTISYDGTRYAGWQSQKNAIAIQDVLERAIKAVTCQKAALVGSGRTDAGVHAIAQVANFRTASRMPDASLRFAINAKLPEDILVTKAEDASPHFNAQKSAKSKIYRYTIYNKEQIDPFLRCYVHKCFYTLDIRRMRKAAKAFMGRHNFAAFMAAGSNSKTSVRTVKHISIEKNGDLIYIYIEANGFLYNMARNIAGTLVEAARGKISPDDVRSIIKKRQRRLCGPTLPAKGLCLVGVKY